MSSTLKAETMEIKENGEGCFTYKLAFDGPITREKLRIVNNGLVRRINLVDNHGIYINGFIQLKQKLGKISLTFCNVEANVKFQKVEVTVDNKNTGEGFNKKKVESMNGLADVEILFDLFEGISMGICVDIFWLEGTFLRFI